MAVVKLLKRKRIALCELMDFDYLKRVVKRYPETILLYDRCQVESNEDWMKLWMIAVIKTEKLDQLIPFLPKQFRNVEFARTVHKYLQNLKKEDKPFVRKLWDAIKKYNADKVVNNDDLSEEDEVESSDSSDSAAYSLIDESEEEEDEIVTDLPELKYRKTKNDAIMLLHNIVKRRTSLFRYFMEYGIVEAKELDEEGYIVEDFGDGVSRRYKPSNKTPIDDFLDQGVKVKDDWWDILMDHILQAAKLFEDFTLYDMEKSELLENPRFIKQLVEIKPWLYCEVPTSLLNNFDIVFSAIFGETADSDFQSDTNYDTLLEKVPLEVLKSDEFRQAALSNWILFDGRGLFDVYNELLPDTPLEKPEAEVVPPCEPKDKTICYLDDKGNKVVVEESKEDTTSTEEVEDEPEKSDSESDIEDGESVGDEDEGGKGESQ